MNASQRIKKAMRDNERRMLYHIRTANKDGNGFRMDGLWQSVMYEALRRLQAKGDVIHRHYDSRSRVWYRHGYWLSGIRPGKRTHDLFGNKL